MLYVVSTPIGNLEDITFRALRILKEADLIAAEDVRTAKKLLKHFEIIEKEIISFHDYNKEKRTPYIIERLKKGEDVAVISERGTPGISDPGFYLVRECVKEKIAISPIPGANAALSALVCSGLPTDKFGFFGFFPKKTGKKEEICMIIEKTQNLTFIFYESPHRLVKTLAVMNDFIPEREIVIARELTKKFEEFIRGKIKDVYEKIKKEKIKGEIVLVVS